jgi:hypothetical protein
MRTRVQYLFIDFRAYSCFEKLKVRLPILHDARISVRSLLSIFECLDLSSWHIARTSWYLSPTQLRATVFTPNNNKDNNNEADVEAFLNAS